MQLGRCRTKLIRTLRGSRRSNAVDHSSRGSTISTVIYGEKEYRSWRLLCIAGPPGDLCAAANCRLSFVRPSKASLIKSFRAAVTQPRLEGGLRDTIYAVDTGKRR